MSNLTEEQQWAEFKTKFNKTYEGEEEQRRFKIFQDTLKTINEHNEKHKRGEVTFTMGINHFADLTDEEKKQFCGGLRLPPSKE